LSNTDNKRHKLLPNNQYFQNIFNHTNHVGATLPSRNEDEFEDVVTGGGGVGG
jgi:hypothetical protein